LDSDERLTEAGCTCNFFQQNQLRKGPCEHILAVRLQHARQLRPRKAGSDVLRVLLSILAGSGERRGVSPPVSLHRRAYAAPLAKIQRSTHVLTDDQK